MLIAFYPCSRCGAPAWCGVEWQRGSRKTHYIVCGRCDPLVRALETSTVEAGHD